MLKNDLAFKLWELANLTVAFCVAQAMTFFYLAADNKLEELLKSTFAQWFAVTISLVGYGLYIAIIWGCQQGAKSLLSKTWNDVEKIWTIATICRHLIILFFTWVFPYEHLDWNQLSDQVNPKVIKRQSCHYRILNGSNGKRADTNYSCLKK